MPLPLYIVGIDLGTTNCAVAFVSPAEGADAPVLDFPIPQLQRPGEVAAHVLLGHRVTARLGKASVGTAADLVAFSANLQANNGIVRMRVGLSV